jgi:hypothetical protein
LIARQLLHEGEKGVAARPYAPARVATEEAEAEGVRQATADLTDTERLVARVMPLRTLVARADTVHQALAPASLLLDPTRTRFEVALPLAHRVLAGRASSHQAKASTR